MSHGKMSDFVSFLLLGFTLVIKLGNTLTFFDKAKYGVRFEYVSWKMSDFDLFPLFGFTSVIKLRNFDFESNQNTLIFLDKRNDARFEYVLSNRETDLV